MTGNFRVKPGYRLPWQRIEQFFQVVPTFASGGDSSEGTTTSPTFKVNSKYIDFLVGGGNHPHNPNTSQPPPPGDLLFQGAALNPPNPGVTTYEQLGWTATGGLVNQPVATGAIGGQQYVSGFQAYSTGLINTFVDGSDAGSRYPYLACIYHHPALYQFPDRRGR